VVKATRGKIEVTPIRAVNIPHSARPLFVQMTYGDQIHRSHEASASSSTSSGGSGSDGCGDEYQWITLQDSKGPIPDNASTNPSREGSYSTSSSFGIDTQNIRGAIEICIASERFRNQKELAFVEIPIFDILDAICVPDRDQLTQWFYLERNRGRSPPTNESGSAYVDDSAGETQDDFKFNGKPCICVSFKWAPETLRFSDVTTQKFHGRLHVPSLSVSMIDSKKACEILQVCVSGIDIRYSDSVELTETSVNVSWLQVDNQLPDAAYAVILSPTANRRPQPVIRMHVRRNNGLCHEHLQSFDLMILILQEIDLHLEQQTITAIWDIIESFVTEKFIRRIGAETRNMTSSNLHVGDGNGSISGHRNGDFSAYQSTPDDDKIYCDYFYIAPILIHVSFIASGSNGSSQEADGQDDKVKREWDSSYNVASGLRNIIPLDHSTPISLFLWQVGDVVLELSSSILDATIELHGMTVSNMFKTMQEVVSTLQEHYLNSTLGQVYRIVGSLDLVTNPVGLLSSLGNGVRDFFFEPAHALITNPTEISKIGGELVKGAFSLARSTADGVLGMSSWDSLAA
jgi:hypothetical protein